MKSKSANERKVDKEIVHVCSDNGNFSRHIQIASESKWRAKHKKPYNLMIRKIYIRTLTTLGISGIIVVIARAIARGKVGNMFAEYYMEKKNVDWYTAVEMYQNNIRQYYIYIIFGSMVLLFLILFSFVIKWITRYFDEIINGVDSIAYGGSEIINMSKELDFMADRFNMVKAELARSANAEREAEKRKDDLIVYLAHDIKTPLTSVIGYLSFMVENQDMTIEQRAKYAKITLEKAYRLEKLIDEFFEITKYNNHSVTIVKQQIDLSYMFVQIKEELYPVLSSYGRDMIINIPDNMTVSADPDKIARVFNNIIKNDISYADKNTSIEVKANKYYASTVISIINIGIIPEDKLNTIFEKFYRLDEARQSSTGGSGLGLAIAKDIISLHNGEIKAFCKNGRTVFMITLPD